MNYSDYEDKQVKKYMQSVEQSIKRDYGEVPDEFELSLMMLADNYNIYLQARTAINTDGVIITVNDTLIKHPMLKVLQDTQISMNKIINSFGLTPLSKSKLKAPQPETDDFTDKFLTD